MKPSQRTFGDLGGERLERPEPEVAHGPTIEARLPTSATPGSGIVEWSVMRQDAVEWLRSLPAASVDLVATDPAYESLEKHRAVGTTTRLKQSKGSSNEWFSIFPNARLAELMQEFYRVLKPDRHCYVMCDHETAFLLKPAGEAAGFKFWKPIIWVKKGGIGMGYHYRAKYEFVMFFEKGKRRLHDLGITDVLEVERVWRKFPTEKPVPLFRTLIEQSTEPGELVIDPFLGSGTTAVAAVGLGRRFAGCDVSPKAVEWALRRLNGGDPAAAAP